MDHQSLVRGGLATLSAKRGASPYVPLGPMPMTFPLSLHTYP